MTSNIGSEAFGKKLARIGFSGTDTEKTYNEEQFAQIKESVLENVKDTLAPELINRLSELVVFKPLTKPVLQHIFKIKLNDFITAWKTKPKVSLPKFTKKKIAQVVDEIYDPAYGARPLERYLIDKVEPDLIDQIMKKQLVE
jgi:ATP-dependent Clp protease ATP-binding subunit ClpA